MADVPSGLKVRHLVRCALLLLCMIMLELCMVTNDQVVQVSTAVVLVLTVLSMEL